MMSLTPRYHSHRLPPVRGGQWADLCLPNWLVALDEAARSQNWFEELRRLVPTN